MEQESLAKALRAGEGVTLASAIEPDGVDVVLAAEWKPLWEASKRILPLAFSGAKGTLPEAAATMLLSRLTQAVFGRNAVDLSDALGLLGFEGPDVPPEMRADLDRVPEVVGDNDRSVDDGYRLLVEVIAEHGGAELPGIHWRYRSRLKHLRARLGTGGSLVPGMTCHQAKGREWDAVGVHLDDAESEMLRAGLDEHNEKHRGLYVACTRARSSTVSI